VRDGSAPASGWLGLQPAIAFVGDIDELDAVQDLDVGWDDLQQLSETGTGVKAEKQGPVDRPVVAAGDKRWSRKDSLQVICAERYTACPSDLADADSIGRVLL
jgi:hypothetical protein